MTLRKYFPKTNSILNNSFRQDPEEQTLLKWIVFFDAAIFLQIPKDRIFGFNLG